MARRRCLGVVVLAVWLALTAGTVSLAQQEAALPQYVGIPSNLMNQYYSQQRSMQWCWAACIQMVFNRYGVDVQQEEIVRRTYGTDPSGNLPDQPASVETMTANMNNWGLDRAGKRYLVRANVGQGAPSPALLINELNAGRPVIFGCQTGMIGHAVVCTAASYVMVQDPTGTGQLVPNVLTLVVRDPMPRSAWAATFSSTPQGRAEYRADQLARAIGAHWVIRVQVEGQQEQARINTSGRDQLVGRRPRDITPPGPNPPPSPAKAPEPKQPAADVTLTKSEARWSEGEAQPSARFSLTYTNAGQQTNSCEVTVAVELASRETEQFERVFQSRKYSFDLRPGRSYTVKGSLDAYQDLDLHPRLNATLTMKPTKE